MSILDDPEFIHDPTNGVWKPPQPQELDAFPLEDELLWQGRSILTAHGEREVRRLFWSVSPFLLLFLMPCLLIAWQTIQAPSMKGVYAGLIALFVFSLALVGTLSIPRTYRHRLKYSQFGANETYLFIQKNTKKTLAYTWVSLPPITYEVDDAATITVNYIPLSPDFLDPVCLLEALEGDAATFAELKALQRAAYGERA